MDGGAWQDTVHGIAKRWTWLSNFHYYALDNLIEDRNKNVMVPLLRGIHCARLSERIILASILSPLPDKGALRCASPITSPRLPS